MLKFEFNSLLFINILTYDGVNSFVKHFNVVVLPSPFTPRKPKHLAYSKQNDNFLTAFFIVFSLLLNNLFLNFLLSFIRLLHSLTLLNFLCLLYPIFL